MNKLPRDSNGGGRADGGCMAWIFITGILILASAVILGARAVYLTVTAIEP